MIGDSLTADIAGEMLRGLIPSGIVLITRQIPAK